ncbi:MAG TPA: FAD-dependent oxidoreductase [Bryobacteraceae bacterium]|nr:FAD-dependent oxidoreductase [Bryobacteraceae bacterium]
MASPPSALDARTQTFPSLTAAQIDRIRPCGTVRRVDRGEILFQPNQTDISFFVLLSGAMEIVQPDFDGGERTVATHGPGHFTGELTMITGRRCLVLGRVTEPGEFLELSGEALRSLVARDAELSEILMRAFILRRLTLVNLGLGNVILLGSRHSAGTLNLREFLSRNGHPYTYIDLDTDSDSQALLDRFHVKLSEVPVVICNTRGVLRNPSIQQLAGCLGFNSTIDKSQVRDLIIVGAGPAGLAAAVYAASEGLNVLVIETTAPGGQAGSSSKIENYLGFPTGVSGMELAARATTQAQKFGANMMIARSVVRLNCDREPYKVFLDGDDSLAAHAIVIATGAQYKKLQLDNLTRFEGKGIYYGATYIESQLCGGVEVAVVGGGNSAGQAAVFLSQNASKVHMLVRSGELTDTMSRYLIQRLTENPKIDLHWNTEITALEGDECLERVTWRNKKSGECETRDVGHIFVMTGASPRTDWLRGCVALDDRGFILTGRDLEAATLPDGMRWPLKRGPYMLETSLPRVFAVGDVRANNVKRVASAVGEGAISISLVHRALGEL